MDSEGKRIFGVLLIMFIVSIGIVFENMSLRNEIKTLQQEQTSPVIWNINLTSECSKLGFCVFDRVEPTKEAQKLLNLSFNGIVRKINDAEITIDMGNESRLILDESWLKHTDKRETGIIIKNKIIEIKILDKDD